MIGAENFRKLRTLWSVMHAPTDRRRVCDELRPWEQYWVEDRYTRALAHPRSFRLTDPDRAKLDRIWERLFGNDNV